MPATRFRLFSFTVFALAALLLLPDPLFAQQATPGQPQSIGEVFSRMLPLFFIVFFIFYFLVIRPQDKKLRDQEALVESLTKGDQVITSSGIIGRVQAVEKEFVLLEISNNVRIKVVRSHISKRYEASNKQSAKQEKKSAA